MPAKARPKKNLSAMKRARQAEKRNLKNRSIKTSIKNIVKKVEAAISAKNIEESVNELKNAIKAISKAASKGVLHKNTASRKISRLSKKVNAILQKPDLPEAGAA